MSNPTPRTRAATAVAFVATALSLSCSSSKSSDAAADPKSGGSATLSTVPGEAGGTFDKQFTASAKITALDPKSRRVTLRREDGTDATFVAPPEVHNFDQLRVGNKVRATFAQRVSVTVEDT